LTPLRCFSWYSPASCPATLSLHDALPISQGDLDVHHGIAGQHARLHSTLDTVVDSRDVFLRDSAAHDGVDELVTLAGLIGLDLEDRKSTRLNSSHVSISYAVFCLKKTRHT